MFKQHLIILDDDTYRHSINVAELAIGFAENKLSLSEKDIKALKNGALFHDIGKAFIDQDILLSERKLTRLEFEKIKEHPERGYAYGKSFLEDIVLRIILEHHERIDGDGYPSNKTGTEIHYLSKIITLCDSYDAIKSARIYRSEKESDFAISEIQRNIGKQFDEHLGGLFLEYIRKIDQKERQRTI